MTFGNRVLVDLIREGLGTSWMRALNPMTGVLVRREEDTDISS